MKIEDVLFAVNDLKEKNFEQYKETIGSIHNLDKKVSVHLSDTNIHFHQRKKCDDLINHIKEHKVIQKAANDNAKFVSIGKKTARISYVTAMVSALTTVIIIHIPEICGFLSEIFVAK